MLILVAMLIIAVCMLNFTISNRVQLTDLRLTVLNLPLDLENYSILHLSDLHGAVYGEKQRAIRTALGDARYSCVIMTGDMLGPDGDTRPLLDLLALVPAETPKYYFPGDTDGALIDSKAHSSLEVYYPWVLELQRAGVTILDRPVLETRGKTGRIWFVPEQLYALDLENMEQNCTRQLEELNERATSLTPDDAARIRALEYELERIAAVKEMKKDFRPEDIQIAVTHIPLTEEYVRDQMQWGGKENYFSMRYVTLILAGHYNNGQWRLPFLGAIWVPEYDWFPKDELITGLDYLNGIPQVISPGLGSAPQYDHEPGRLFNPPGITRIFLTRKAT